MTELTLLCGTVNSNAFTKNYVIVGTGSKTNNATESLVQIRWRTAGTSSKLRIFVITNTLDNVWTSELRKGGSDVNQSLSISATSTGFFEDASNTDTIASGDDMSIGADGTVASSGALVGKFAIMFEPTTGQKFLNKGVMDMQTTGGIRHTNIMGTWTSSLNVVQHKAKYPFTFKNLLANVSSNTFTDSTTYEIWIDGAIGNLSVSVPTVTTGIFEDTSSTDDVVLDELVSAMVDPLGSGNISAIMTIELESSSYTLYDTRLSHTLAASSTQYFIIAGFTNSPTEINVKTVWKALTLDNWSIFVNTNSSNFISTGVTRIDGSDGNVTISVGAGATGFFEDLTNNDEVPDDAELNLAFTGAAGSGSVTFEGSVVRVTNKQFARPDGDSAIGSWTDDGGGTTNIYQSIDEVIADDSDFIQSESVPVNSIYIATLSNVGDPGSSDDHVVRYRYRKSDAVNVIDLIVRLKQGASTVIASKTHTGVSTTFVEGEFLLTGTEADNITDYNDLRIEFEADVP